MPPPVDCALVMESLEAHLDDELVGGEARAIADHLAGCTGCAAELRLAAEIRDGLRALPSYDAPDGLRASIRRAAGGSSLMERLRRAVAGVGLRPLPVFAAAAAAVVVAIGLWLAPQLRRLPSADPEVSRATAEARYALGLVAGVTRNTGRDIRNDVFGERVLLPAVIGLARSLRGEPARNHAEIPEDTHDEGASNETQNG